ncbi:MAG: 2-succinyl-5-enolpyruvyl-6-hydroxy-3-cyclohexene-1-carboxylate synthase [Ruminococcus sp.]|nr:2-succinyl-5-enolpyruvyl-6-hydroxy-3-cyclohexene-1-carboxylate synthase [Ruminococcus sp.]
MGQKYSIEKNTQRLIAIMKHHGIRKVVVSPGAQNICFVGSIQHDGSFEIYSAPDERSAAYIACGLAAESGEAVALSCTGATASRNYVPALTEAYYRKLPILAITATKHPAFIGQNVPQVIDRSSLQNDIAKKSVYVPTIQSKDDDWGAVVAINSAILEMKRGEGGPVHISLETTHSSDYSVEELPKTRFIDRLFLTDRFPSIDPSKKTAIFVGAHLKWTPELTAAVERFCERYNAVVLCDHTSNYHGKYKILPALVTYQSQYHAPCTDIDLLIDMGNVSGAYIELKPKQVWRVHQDGEIRDQFRAIRLVFQMDELSFFKRYTSKEETAPQTSYYEEWKKEYDELLGMIPEIPLSNLWMAKSLSPELPGGSVLHLGILNSLRSWNFFHVSEDIDCYCNTGGFGIDGPVSTVLGGALAAKDRIHYLVLGDLAFFYDLNSLGNRHYPDNIRILLINNGVGTEFKNYSHKAALFGDDADMFMAARGHYGNKSPVLVKHYAEDLGIEYLTASDKAGFKEQLARFTDTSVSKPMILEVFTDSSEESDALKAVRNMKTSIEGSAKNIVKKLLGPNNAKTLKKLLGK